MSSDPLAALWERAASPQPATEPEPEFSYTDYPLPTYSRSPDGFHWPKEVTDLDSLREAGVCLREQALYEWGLSQPARIHIHPATWHRVQYDAAQQGYYYHDRRARDLLGGFPIKINDEIDEGVVQIVKEPYIAEMLPVGITRYH